MMAKLFVKEIGLLFVLYFVYTQVKNWLSWRALKKFGTKHGCGDVPVEPNILPGGIERYAIFLKGMKGMLDYSSDLLAIQLDDDVVWQSRTPSINT
jgi:hypothetical protein